MPDRFAWADTDSYEEADVVLFGVPDESGSHADREGTSEGPDAVRRVSNERYVVFRGGQRSVFRTYCPIDERITDHGDVDKDEVSDIVRKIRGDGKMPVCVGGDHSITFDVMKGFEEELSVVYFDAHPDFVCSTKNYYGSVMCDLSGLENVPDDQVVLVGTRAPEPEEMENIEERGIRVISPIDIEHMGLREVYQEIERTVGENIYLSLDMDVLDPAFAPGVGAPVPGGLTSSQLMYLVRRVAELGLGGLDVMETAPPHDIQDMTASTAAKLIAEAVSCS